MQKKMKIAFVMGKMDTGGKKTLAMQYFLNMDRSRCEIHFICDEDSNSVDESLINAEGGLVHYVAPYQKLVTNMMDLRRVFKREQFDVLHAFNSTMNLPSLREAYKTGIPVRISESLSMANEKEIKTCLKLILRSFSHRYATHYMACGEECGRWQFGDDAFDKGEVAVFKTAIDSDACAYSEETRKRARCALGFTQDDLLVGFIGRFVTQKNPVFLMEVVDNLFKINPSVKMLLIGDGPLKERMFQVLNPDKCKKIRYLGRTENIGECYQAMDALLLPSLYEGLPVVGLEAQCAGCEVVMSGEVTKETSFTDLAHFISLDDGAYEWAEKINQILLKRTSRRSRASECVASGFDSRYEAARLQEYYFKALESEGR